ncbi:MAG: hypothetical protein ACKVUS_13045 [Saprospiraceae bacterium]
MQYEQNPTTKKFFFTPATKQEWLSTGTWALFFAVLGFVLFGLYALGLLFAVYYLVLASAMLAMYFSFMSAGMLLGVVAVLLMYLATMFVLFFGSRHHLRFARTIKQATQSNNQTMLEEAWLNMRKAWRLYGNYTVVLLAVYFVLLVFVGYAMQNSPFLRGF